MENNISNRGRKAEDPIQIVVIYGLEKSKKRFMKVFENVLVDDIINGSKRKPLIDDKYSIIDIGVGKSYVELYKKQYSIK